MSKNNEVIFEEWRRSRGNEVAKAMDDPKVASDVHVNVARSIAAAIRSPEFDKMIRAMAAEAAKTIVVEKLSERVVEIDQRISAMVAERFDQAVEAACQRELAAAIDDVRSRLRSPK